MNAELGCQDDASNKTEERRCTVPNQKGNGDGEGLNKGAYDAKKNDKHTPHRSKHGVVDAGGVTAECNSDNIADQSQSQQCPQEGPCSKGDLRERHFEGFWGVEIGLRRFLG